ncbi:MAG: 50S ribosomal protein L5 [Candidatus Paceibacterota bacterium]|jgi:large subunit ribosomal protein L5
MASIIKEKYQKEVIPALKEKLGIENVMALPKITKVVINIGFGRMILDKGTKDEQRKLTNYIIDNLTQISGQKPIATKSRKSISAFKTREGMVIGAKVTLRGARLYDFLEKLINVALPRSRDFQGISESAVDSSGNLNIGIKEHISFPEISPERSPLILGLETTVVTTAKSREKGMVLFTLLGFPFKKQ